MHETGPGVIPWLTLPFDRSSGSDPQPVSPESPASREPSVINWPELADQPNLPNHLCIRGGGACRAGPARMEAWGRLRDLHRRTRATLATADRASRYTRVCGRPTRQLSTPFSRPFLFVCFYYAGDGFNTLIPPRTAERWPAFCVLSAVRHGISFRLVVVPAVPPQAICLACGGSIFHAACSLRTCLHQP